MTGSGRISLDTSWGSFALSWSDRGLTRARLPGAGGVPGTPAAPPPDIARCAEMLQAYFAGETVDFTAIPLDMSGLSDMDAAIYSALCDVGYGRSTTYGELATLAGLAGPEAARAVGVAMGQNPWTIVVPCHRVLAKNGTLGGYSAPGGTVTKRKLLKMEGVETEGGTPTLPGLFD